MIDSGSLCHTVRLQTYYFPGLLCAEEHPELLMALYLLSIHTYLHICPVPFVVSAVVSNRLQPKNTAITFFHTCCQEHDRLPVEPILFEQAFLTPNVVKYPTIATPSIPCTDRSVLCTQFTLLQCMCEIY